MQRPTTRLRSLLKRGGLLYAPVTYDPLGGKLVERLGFRCVYVGGFATGGSLATTEPLLTMDEQVRVAAAVANAVKLPLLADGGAGFGEPLHTMRTVREFIRAGVAGIHIEDQIYPKRAHYHKYVAHAIPVKDFVSKIGMACQQRDRADKDFLIIARSDTCRFFGLGEAVRRVNRAADAGADMGLVFPRNHKEAVEAPKKSKIPLVYVISRGNRDGRPLYSLRQLEEMGYRIAIDAILTVGLGFHFLRKALLEIRKTGDYTGMTHEEFVRARQDLEDTIGLEEYYAIEEKTVEKKKWGKR
jgi:methylisocitrate lyase